MTEIQSGGGKLITCILPQNAALPLMEKLMTDKGVMASNFHHARGVGRAGVTRKGLGHFIEKDILMITVGDGEAEDIFNYVYFEAHLNEAQGGLILMEKLDRLTPLTLPET